MSPKSPSYIDLAIKRQVMLERLKSGQVRDFAKVIKDIEKLVRQTLLGLDEDVGEISRTKLNKLLSNLRTDQAAVYKTGTTAFTKNLTDISGLYASQEILDLKKTVDLRGSKLNSFTKKDVFAKAIKRPLTTDGQLLQPWIKDFSNREVVRVNNTIRAGWSQGKTNQQLVQQIIGTKAQNYKDGILQTTRRNASTMVRTSTQHVAGAARQETWEANRDVVDKYEFLATLDRSTSSQCRALDGQKFDFGKGPVPPIHPNCRSTTTPVLNEKFSFLSEGRTRSGETGPVSAEQSYYDWLKNQPASVQNEVLGPTRAKLFQSGGMSAERFRKLQFDKNFEPLTLDQMRAIEPKAFKAVGIGVTTPRPKVGPSVYDGLIETHGDIDKVFVGEVEKAVGAFPLNIMTKLKANGYKVDVGERITIIRPDLKGVHPRGWSAGMTWDHAEGFQTRGRIAVAKTRKIIGNGFVKSTRMQSIVGHETGHAVDLAYKISTTPEFVTEWKRLKRKFGKDRNLKYFMQKGAAGPSETMAELFGQMYGEGRYTKFPSEFDTLKDMIRGAVE